MAAPAMASRISCSRGLSRVASAPRDGSSRTVQLSRQTAGPSPEALATAAATGVGGPGVGRRVDEFHDSPVGDLGDRLGDSLADRIRRQL